MPTLNLGRVRFNWKGAYDPLTSYLEYDCVEDDGQSYVCIAPITGTGPNDTGGGTFWAAMLVRSADYNQARQDAIDAANAAQTSATAAATSEGNAATSEANASGSASLSQRWASEVEDVEVAGGEYSAKHYAAKAAAFGDPNQFNLTADQTADTRTAAEWMAAVLAAQQKASDNETDIASLSAVTATAFIKADGSQPAWTAPTGTTLETASALALVVGGKVVQVPAGAAISLPSLSSGTDYTIYASDEGSLQALTAASSAPSGQRAVGGFHASAGGAAIVATSLWDLNWRPAAPSPRAMVLSLDKRIWADIYLMDTQYANNGYSRNGAQIADDGSRPVIPSAYGGNGSSTYGSMSWWVAVDLATAAGKRLPHYQEFIALAYGVVERQAVGTDPGTTQHQAGHRSACGVEQATGVMWQWGADINGTSATGSASWQDIAEGRGEVYTHSIRSPLFGAGWDHGSQAGSRASIWNRSPSNSVGNVGARGVCDHVNLQAER